MYAYHTQQNGGIGVCLYTGRQTLHSLQHCVNWIVTGARILEIQIRLRVLVEKYEKNNGVSTIYDALPLRALQVAFGYVVVFTTMK